MPPSKAKKSAARKKPPARPASRSSRAAQLQRARERRSIRRRLVFAGVLLAVGAAAFGITTIRQGGDAAVIDQLEASGACAYDTKTDANPPSGGKIGDGVEAAAPNFYRDAKKAPTDDELRKAMRRGFVVLWYRTPVAKDVDQAATRLSDRFGRDLIVVPRASLAVPVAATAWERRLVCKTVDEPVIAQFTDSFRDRGPEKGFL